MLRLQAGEGGSSSFVVPADEAHPARWQTPRQRQLTQQSPFQLSVGRETMPGVPAETMHSVLASDSAISWTATLHPFAAELPVGADWVHFGRFTEADQDVKRLAQDWTRTDEHNPYLDEVIPGRFVRAAVIKNANNDLALAAAAGCTVTMDGLHSQVVAQRFGDEAGWKFQRYAIPFLFPRSAIGPGSRSRTCAATRTWPGSVRCSGRSKKRLMSKPAGTSRRPYVTRTSGTALPRSATRSSVWTANTGSAAGRGHLLPDHPAADQLRAAARLHGRHPGRRVPAVAGQLRGRHRGAGNR